MARLGSDAGARTGGAFAAFTPFAAISCRAAAPGGQERTPQLFRLTVAHGWFEQPTAEDGRCRRRRRREPWRPEGHVIFSTWSP